MANPTNTWQRTMAWCAVLCAVTLLMRGSITCVGVLTEQVVATFGIDYTDFGVLNALPIVLFGLGCFFAQASCSRLGVNGTVTLALMLVFVGAIGRLFPVYETLLLSTVLIGLGISFLNVLMPVLLKEQFHEHIDVATGIFTGLIGLSGAIGTFVSVPLLRSAGTLAAPFGVWICFAGAALFGWTVVSKSEPAVRQTGGFSAGFLKYPTVWAITLAMALQSLMIYTTAAWLPTILRETRFSVEQAAVGVSIYLLISVPTSIATPWLIKLFRGERFTVLFAAVNYAVGVTLWLFGGKAALLGCLMAGVSQGLCLSLAMLVMARKTNSLTELFRISGFAQGIGYVIAGLGPWCCGVLYEATSQTYVIAVVMLATVAMWGASAAFAYAGDSIGNSV